MLIITKNDEKCFEGIPLSLSEENGQFVNIELRTFIDISKGDNIQIEYEKDSYYFSWKGDVVVSTKFIAPEPKQFIVIRIRK
jgi:hypothetical protein